MDLRYKLKTAPITYPASLDDLKRNLRIPTTEIDTDRDALLQGLLDDAIQASQNATGRQYCPATYTLYLDEYPENDEIEIPLGPVASVTSVKYYAEDAVVLTEVDEADWQLDNSELTARLRFLESFSPDTERMNVIEIEFVCGWAAIGNQAPPVPKDLKQAIILRASEAYLHPENAAAGRYLTAAENKERNYRVERY